MQELKSEFFHMFWKRQKVLDVVFPPIIFVLANSFFELGIAISLALTYSLLVILWRLRKKQNFWYAVGGSGGVIVSLLSVVIFSEARDYFLPSLIKNVSIVFFIALSIIIRKPIVAISSHIARGWPLKWFMHPQVYPAYFETTLLWLVYFGGRAYLQYEAFQAGNVEAIAYITTLAGIPGIAVLLVVTYLFGRWRLKNLKGPSVEELKNNINPPWEGQEKGF